MNDQIPENLTWKCKSCGSILGYLSEDKDVLRVKYKDLLIYFSGGVVERNCRSCGSWNRLNDVETSKEVLLKTA